MPLRKNNFLGDFLKLAEKFPTAIKLEEKGEGGSRIILLLIYYLILPLWGADNLTRWGGLMALPLRK